MTKRAHVPICVMGPEPTNESIEHKAAKNRAACEQDNEVPLSSGEDAQESRTGQQKPLQKT